MAPETSRATRREYAAKLILILFFLSLFAGFAWLQRNNAFHPGPFDLVLLGLATLRLGRLVAFDVVAEPLRRPFTETKPDETGAGDSVEARGEGVQKALGQLISCPICAGTWVAALLTYGLYALPQPTRIFLAMTSAISLAEILNAGIEALSWSGQLSRTRSGRYNLAREGKASLVKPIESPECEENQPVQPPLAPGERYTPDPAVSRRKQ